MICGRVRICLFSVHKAFHATPNVYKRKSKEIRMESEPCGVNCFLLQVCLTHSWSTYLCILFGCNSLLFFPCVVLCRKGPESLWIRICCGHRGPGGDGGSSVPPAPPVLDRLDLLRKAKRETVTMRPRLPQVGMKSCRKEGFEAP